MMGIFKDFKLTCDCFDIVNDIRKAFEKIITGRETKKMKWMEKDIIARLEEPGLMITADKEPGGDHDTCPIIVDVLFTDDVFFIRGFDPDNPIKDPHNVDIMMVEVTDGKDSRGGCNSKHSITIRAHAEIIIKLNELGFDVVPSMKDYF